jgi:eukaryotic-like serine/threonine-protein kinase
MAERKLRAVKDPRIGEIVAGKWEVTSVLRVGTMATTYAARHRNGHRVALKVLHATWSRDASLACRFTRSGYLANGVCHRGVVPAIDDGVTADGCPFLVYTLLTGENLEARRVERERLPVKEVLELCVELLEILHAAHTRGIVHRNLKPENVFVTDDGEVKLLGFGTSALGDGRATSDVTDAYTAIGTPAFMAPEQARGQREDVDATTDVFGVGATMFTLLSGEHVHRARGARELLRRAADEPARSLAEATPGLPEQVVAIVDRALAFSREERWPSALIMAEALRWALRSTRGSSRVRRRILATADAQVEDPTLDVALGARDDDVTATDPAPAEPDTERPSTSAAIVVTAARAPAYDDVPATVPAPRPPITRRRVAAGAALMALTLGLGVASGAGTRRWVGRAQTASSSVGDRATTRAPASAATAPPTPTVTSLATAPAEVADDAPSRSTSAHAPAGATPPVRAPSRPKPKRAHASVRPAEGGQLAEEEPAPAAVHPAPTRVTATGSAAKATGADEAAPTPMAPRATWGGTREPIGRELR